MERDQISAGENLPDVILETVTEVMQQNRRLNLAVINTISNGYANNEELIAALLLMEKLSASSRELIEAKGEIIFSKNEVKQTGPLVNDFSAAGSGSEEKNKPEEDAPKSFEELLHKRIDEFLPDSDIIRKSEIKNILRNNAKVRKISKGLGYIPSRSKLLREEAFLLTKVFLREPSTVMRKQPGYTGKEIKLSFFNTRRDKLREYCKEIGFNWSDDMVFDFETMKDIRGLITLDKLKEKTAKSRENSENANNAVELMSNHSSEPHTYH